MSNASSLILLPFFGAFLVFCWRFYAKESAASSLNPSFLLAILTIATALAYLVLGVMHMLPDYSTLGFGIVGVILFGLAIYRMMLI